MKIAIMSDDHGYLPPPERVALADVLVHCGDFTRMGDVYEVRDFNYWLSQLPHAHKIVVAGNHERFGGLSYGQIREHITRAHYLCNTGVEIDGIKFYGTPFTPNYDGNDCDLDVIFNMIPRDVDVLVTHAPPRGTLDGVRVSPGYWDSIGSQSLKERMQSLSPKVHAFGHVHEMGGRRLQRNGTLFVNGCILDTLGMVRPDVQVVELHCGVG